MYWKRSAEIKVHKSNENSVSMHPYIIKADEVNKVTGEHLGLL
ncbi:MULTISPECIES: hypothetical protein [Peribacillus]